MNYVDMQASTSNLQLDQFETFNARPSLFTGGSDKYPTFENTADNAKASNLLKNVSSIENLIGNDPIQIYTSSNLNRALA